MARSQRCCGGGGRDGEARAGEGARGGAVVGYAKRREFRCAGSGGAAVEGGGRHRSGLGKARIRSVGEKYVRSGVEAEG